MSTRGWKFRIDDILEAIWRIQEYSAGLDFSAWQQDQKTVDAVIRNFEIIGEAANHVPDEVQERFPKIPWAKMRGIRNVLIHEYFGVDIEVVWRTIQDDLPGLKMLLMEIEKS
jgi:uncharacterized protein with HEPN domain